MQAREERLLDAFLNGNDTAFEELVRENTDRLYRVAMRILRNHDDALDVLQDSLVKAYRRAPSFRRESSFSTWLMSIVVREAINKAKRDRFRNASDPISPVQCTGPGEQAETTILAGRISEAVESLPPAQRAVFVMRQYEGLKTSEIAQLTGSNEGTVKANYFLAVRKLRLKLSPFLERSGKS